MERGRDSIAICLNFCVGDEEIELHDSMSQHTCSYCSEVTEKGMESFNMAESSTCSVISKRLTLPLSLPPFYFQDPRHQSSVHEREIAQDQPDEIPLRVIQDLVSLMPSCKTMLDRLKEEDLGGKVLTDHLIVPRCEHNILPPVPRFFVQVPWKAWECILQQLSHNLQRQELEECVIDLMKSFTMRVPDRQQTCLMSQCVLNLCHRHRAMGVHLAPIMTQEVKAELAAWGGFRDSCQDVLCLSISRWQRTKLRQHSLRRTMLYSIVSLRGFVLYFERIWEPTGEEYQGLRDYILNQYDAWRSKALQKGQTLTTISIGIAFLPQSHTGFRSHAVAWSTRTLRGKFMTLTRFLSQLVPSRLLLNTAFRRAKTDEEARRILTDPEIAGACVRYFEHLINPSVESLAFV